MESPSPRKRTATLPGTMKAMRDAILSLDPNLAVFNAETMREHVDKALMLPRVCATLLGVFGGTGLLLAAIGLYGVMSYAVRSRTREIGIRMALGAESRGVLKMVTKQGLTLAGAGLMLGPGVRLCRLAICGTVPVRPQSHGSVYVRRRACRAAGRSHGRGYRAGPPRRPGWIRWSRCDTSEVRATEGRCGWVRGSASNAPASGRGDRRRCRPGRPR